MKAIEMVRLGDVHPGYLPVGFDLPSMTYYKTHGEWQASLGDRVLANLSEHQVTEHDDGTITVTPSILVTAPGKALGDPDVHRHGHIKRGVWTPCEDDRP